MRRPHNVAVELLAQNFRILPLHAPGHSLADKRKGLVTIESPQFDDLAVQRKTVIRKSRFTEADASRVFVDLAARSQQIQVHRIEFRLLKIPQLYIAQPAQRNSVTRPVV